MLNKIWIARKLYPGIWARVKANELQYNYGLNIIVQNIANITIIMTIYIVALSPQTHKKKMMRIRSRKD